MLKKININFIFTFLLFLNPFITFFNSNVYEIIFYLNDFLFLFSLSLFVFLFSYLLINKKFFTTIIILYFSLFKYKFIYTIFQKINLLNFIYPITLTVLLFFFFKYLIKNIKFLKFIIIFLTINLLLLSFDTAIKIVKIDYNKYQSSKTQLKNIPFTSKKNIYYIIVDEMISLENFNTIETLDVVEIKKNYAALDAIVLKNINSTASETIVNYLNILNLDNVNNNNADINHLYFLVKFFFKNPEKSPLLKMLDDNNYKFFFIGNQWLNCNNLETKTCLPFERNNKKLFNLYLIKSFLGSTPLKDFIVLLRDKLHNNTFLLSSEANAFYDNDAMNKLINNFPYLDNNKYFFFAHHLSPHDPWVFNRDCSFRIANSTINEKFNSEISKKNAIEGYKDAYICTLKKIEIFLKFVKEKDPNSIIFIMSDTAINPNQANFLIEKFPTLSKSYNEIFALVRLPKNCNFKELNNLDNITLIIKSIECGLN